MKITTKSWPNGHASACIDYDGIVGDPGTSVAWCIKVDTGWVFNSEENHMFIRMNGGGWYVYGDERDPLRGVRFPSRRSILAAYRIGK